MERRQNRGVGRTKLGLVGRVAAREPHRTRRPAGRRLCRACNRGRQKITYLDGMRPIESVADRPLTWAQPSGQRVYELSAAGELVAALVIGSRSLAMARAADVRLTFERQGLGRPSFVVRLPTESTTMAVLRLPGFLLTPLSPRVLEFPDGRRFRLAPTPGGLQWVSQSQPEVALMLFDARRTGPFARTGRGPLGLPFRWVGRRSVGSLQVFPSAVRLSELNVLALLGWYQSITWYDELSD